MAVHTFYITNTLFKSVGAATTTGAGEVAHFPGIMPSNFTLGIDATGSPASLAVALEVSFNGTDWYAVATKSSVGVVTVNHQPFPYVRANLTTLTGGTSPTVTAWIAWSD